MVPVDDAMHGAVPAVAALGVSSLVRLADMQGWMVKRKPPDLCLLFSPPHERRRFPPLGRLGFGSLITLERFNPNPTLADHIPTKPMTPL